MLYLLICFLACVCAYLFFVMTGETPPPGGSGTKVTDPNDPLILISSDLSSVSDCLSSVSN